jgi:hypothetical protein
VVGFAEELLILFGFGRNLSREILGLTELTRLVRMPNNSRRGA